MKINTKEYYIPKIIKFHENEPVYEEVTDPLSKSWNDLHLLHSVEDKLKDLRLNINHSKVEADTLLTTYDLINKGIIKQHDIINQTPTNNQIEEKININIIRPCINLLDTKILSNRQKEEEKEVEYLIYLKIHSYEYLEYRKIKEFRQLKLDEQKIENDDLTFIIRKECRKEEDKINLDIKKLIDFVIDNNIKINRNVRYINLYISKMYIMSLGINIINYGKILEDGYGEIVFVIEGEDVYKIVRETERFSVYKNELKI